MKFHIDFETRSTLDLKRTSVYRYAEDPTTDLWVAAYAFEDEPVRIWFPGDPVPEEIGDRVQDLEVHAWNAQFERVMWALILGPRYGFPVPTREQYHDTMVLAAAAGLPMGLDKAAVVLDTAKKDAEGRKLMLQMARPRRARTSQGEDPDAVYWWDDPERLARLTDYCMQDVRVEREISRRLRPLSDFERRVFLIDQEMNDRGVLIDVDLVDAAQDMSDEAVLRANKELQELTGGEVTAVTKTAEMRESLGLDSVAKDVIRDLLEEDDGEMDAVTRQVLEIRQDVGKSSVAKLDTMERWMNSDHRVRGMFQYHGAGTGRWAGRGVQPQNLPRPEDIEGVDDIEDLIPLVMARDYAGLEAVAPPMVVLSSMIRSMMIARPGHRFIGGDYAQIEARVLAWLAEQDNLVRLFAEGGKVYEDMASFIYGIPVDEIAKDSVERQIGKNTILGAGFQMGPDTFIEQVKKQTGIDLPFEDADRAIKGYRKKNDKIVDFWYAINDAAIAAVGSPETVVSVGRGGAIRFLKRGDYLYCILPSGRPLHYALPSIRRHVVRPKRGDPFETTAVSFMAVNGYTRRWQRHYGYGGLWTENVVQATARDLLARSMVGLHDAGYRPTLTVHDELVGEVPNGHGSIEEFTQIMADVPAWAGGLPVEVESWEGARYRK